MSTSILQWVWLMPALMGVSFVAILFFGKRLPRKGSEIGIAAVGACFIFALLSTAAWIGHVNDAHHAVERQGVATEQSTELSAEAEAKVDPITTEKTWFQIGDRDFEVGTLVDGLSVMMFLVVTIISLLVHVYSTDYVGGDRRYTHYFAFLSL